MKKQIFGFAIALILSSAAIADNYEAEVGLELANFDNNVRDINVVTVSGEIFFDAVDTSRGPLAEASFLDQASGVKVYYADVENPGDNGFGVSGRFVTSGDMILEGSYDDLGDDEVLSLGIGAYLSRTTDLVVSFTSDDDIDADYLTAKVHSLVDLSGPASLAYTAEASLIDADNDNGYGLGGDVTYFINDDLGFGGSLSVGSVNDVDIREIAAHVDFFILPDLHLSASFRTVDLDGPDIDVLSVGVFVRF